MKILTTLIHSCGVNCTKLMNFTMQAAHTHGAYRIHEEAGLAKHAHMGRTRFEQ